ncbi:MAG: divalent-cation tolerance protein CutA [Acidobacteriia bacterium]|nr:divalent-cation tolerance protein CutA [Terriglobia bacterium]
MVSGKQARVVLVTCGSLGEARRIARAVVEGRLAACVNIVGAPVESVYRWKGKVEKAREYLLVMKTTEARLAALEREVTRLHNYDVPEFIALAVSAGSREYLRWLQLCVATRRYR